MAEVKKYGMTIECGDFEPAQVHVKIVLDEIFVGKVYDFSDVKGKQVLDIGAYFGDTAIYFSKKGAKEVYALEPFDSFNYIIRNCELNGVTNVQSLHGAISFSEGYSFVDRMFKNYGASKMSDGVGLSKIRCYSIKSLVEQFQIKDGVLKIDCEGDEFDSILSSPKSVLRIFESMMIEVHSQLGDTKELSGYLSFCGFRTFIKKGVYSATEMLYAIRDDIDAKQELPKGE